MVVACAGPHLGAAILDRLTNEFLQLVKLQAQPSVIYVSSQASQELVQALRLPTSGDGIMPAGGPGSTGQPECATPRDHIALLNTLVDLSQEQQVSALGALLLIMQKVLSLVVVSGGTAL
ncbi:hypothetical protein HaLaN_07164 [Haematococcus lacustris]|uniref:Uncharacterized protein n=1 Tax=Haematococcus lacustris TaxID=44745 RepID=A0A699YND8_HAELA|nr:hypothetical protein HaLaN_07164 [Haematococcus lacustris]